MRLSAEALPQHNAQGSQFQRVKVLYVQCYVYANMNDKIDVKFNGQLNPKL